MEHNAEIEADGFRWLIGAGLVAVLLCIFLINVDRCLSTSRKEKVLESTLKELRLGQTTLKSRVTDERQLNTPNQAFDNSNHLTSTH